MATITEQQIHQIADALDQQGIKPTLAAVRSKLGGGSYTTISEAMKSWRSHQLKKELSAMQVIPDQVKEIMDQANQTIWQMAISIAEERLQSQRQSFIDEKAMLEETRNEALEMADRLSHDIDDLKQAYQKISALNDRLEKDKHALDNKLAAITKMHELQASQLKKLEADLHKAHDKMIEAIEHAAVLKGELSALKKSPKTAAKSTKSQK